VLIRVELDQRSGWHLERALDQHRLWCEQHPRFRPIPENLVDLQRHAAIAKTAPDRQEPESAASEGTIESMNDYLTQRAFGAHVGRSERTVRNWIRSGKIRTTVAGIPRSELERIRHAA
jgi:hypothetical protein